jgi:hypothetical protein
MPSPFPGVDPYLESQHYWPDFHARFMNYWCEALADKLPENYEARMDERVNLVGPPAVTNGDAEPDLVIPAAPRSQSATASPLPVTLPLLIADETREPYIQILHRPERKLVGVLELLSPACKAEPWNGGYRQQRWTWLRQDLHLIELDLLLGGRRMPLAHDYPLGNYFALVAPGDRRPDCDVYAWGVRQALPTFPIPLLSPDPPIRIDLGAAFSLTYDRGRYARSIDYTAPPHPALTEEDQAWAMETARAAGVPPAAP